MVRTVLYREIYGFLVGRDDTSHRFVTASALDLPRPLARGVVHFFDLLKRSAVRNMDEDLADQIALAVSSWFAQLHDRDERQLRLVASPLADHLNEIVPELCVLQRRIRTLFGVGAGWNVLEPIPPDIAPGIAAAELVMEQLRGHPALEHLAHLLVRGMPETPPEQIVMQEAVPETVIVETDSGLGDTRGFHSGSRQVTGLSQADLALLSHPETEDLFAHRYTGGSLLHLHHRRRQQAVLRTGRVRVRQVRQNRPPGPVFVAIDTSGSMRGEAEGVAREITLALCREAVQSHRTVRGYAFRAGRGVVGLEDTTMPTPASPDPHETQSPVATGPPPRINMTFLQELAEFLRMPLAAGADVVPALDRILQQLDPRQTEAVEVLLVSDAGVPRLPPRQLNLISALQNSGAVRFHALTVNESPLKDPLNLFDYRWFHENRK